MIHEELIPLFDNVKMIPPENGLPLDGEYAQELFKKLEPLLEAGDPQCLNFIGKLRLVAGTAELIQEMEDSYFGEAAVTLGELKTKDTRRRVSAAPAGADEISASIQSFNGLITKQITPWKKCRRP